MKNAESIKQQGDVIWNIANLLRGPYRPPQYRRVMIPLTGQEDEKVRLSELINILNERFGTDFTQADQLFFDQIQEEAIENDALKKAAETNSKADFRYVFEKAFEGLVIDRMEGNEEIFGKLMSNGEFRKLAVEHLLHKVYGALKN